LASVLSASFADTTVRFSEPAVHFSKTSFYLINTALLLRRRAPARWNWVKRSGGTVRRSHLSFGLVAQGGVVLGCVGSSGYSVSAFMVEPAFWFIETSVRLRKTAFYFGEYSFL
jgi:hypothetical protein